MSIFLRWGVPAFVTVIGGTAAAIATSGAAIPEDLQARASAAIATNDTSWAQVDFDMRDAVLTGTATSQQMVDEAASRIAAVRGVRSVTTNVSLAEYASPYPFLARVSNGAITLAGGLPDEPAHAEFLAMAGEGAIDEMRPMSGAPARTTWIAAVGKALAYARQMDEGEVALSDLSLTASGRAKSAAAYDELVRLEAAPVPAGLTVAFADFTPPLQSPYEWRAEFDGHRLILSGAVPSDAVAEGIEAVIPAGTEVSNSLVLASGAPQGFEPRAVALVENLLKLQSGSAFISDTESTIAGAPPDAATSDAIRLAMTSAGTEVTLSPPTVAKFWFSGERAGDKIVLDGYVTDAAMRDRLAALPGVNADGLELARGASDRFASAVDFVLDNLRLLSEGRARVDGTAITLIGRAASSADFDHLETVLDLGAPQGLILAQSSIKPPLAAPFTFAVEKLADGKFAMSGHVPSRATRRAIIAAVPGGAADTTTIADGQPAGFEVAATKAISVLALLDKGSVSYDGTGWSLAGAVDDPTHASAAEVAFADTGLRSAGWSYSVELPAAEVPATIPAEPEVATAPDLAPAPVENTVAEAPEAEVPAAEPVAAVADPAEPVDVPAETAEPAPVTEVAALSPEPATPPAPVERHYVFEASKVLGGPVAFTGAVPADATRRFLAVITNGEPSDSLTIQTGLPADFVSNAEAGSRALALLADGQFGLDGNQWIFTGRAESDAGRVAALAELAGVPAASHWQKAVTLLPPLLVCEDKVGAFAARNAILFQSGSALIDPESLPAIDELAGDLALCPEATVEVEGHTDSDGDDLANLALSVARAEAVVQALVDHGVSGDRLYAVGYGESLPIASNETRAGKQANRRIAFTLSDE